MMMEQGGADPYGRLTDIALHHKRLRPDAPAYIWLRAGEDAAECLSFSALYDQAARIASVLAALGRPGERILLMYPPTGLDFIPAFLGCLLAGAVPVPAYKPSAHRDKADRLEAIVGNAQASVIMSTAQGFEESARGLAASPILAALDRIVSTIDAPAHGMIGAPRDEGSVAFLQYTSGSTAAPKGVIVTHDNLAHNARIIAQSCECDAASVFLTWLPLFHDLGLIGNVLQSLRFGVPCYVMSPASFLQRPARWIAAMSRFGVTNAAAPNFAYDLCAQKHEAQPKTALDLRAVRVLLNGAEKVRPETQRSFNRVFCAYGLSPHALRPAYGLAEATLIVSMAGPQNAGDGALNLDAQALEAGRLQQQSPNDRGLSLAGAGHIRGNQKIAIVNPDTGQRCARDRVGEIWVQGGSVAAGYWANDAATREVFGAVIAGERGTWLRTGDLGVMDNGQLIVTGRCKELIILHGRNHYPQDIEALVQAVSSSLRRDGGAAFGVDTPQGESLVVVQEMERTALRAADPQSLTTQVRRALWDAAEIGLHDLVLVRPGSVPKTSSGKIQRNVARTRYLAGELARLDAQGGAAQPRPPMPAPAQDQHADTLIAWLRDYAGTRINSRLMDERRSMPPSLVLDFGNVGLLGMQAPRAYGGLGMAESGFLRVVEQLGAIDQTLALFVTLNNVLGIRPIANHGSAAVRDRHLPLLATGRELGAFAMTEPGAGSNPLAMQSTAAPRPGGGFILSGGKIWSGSAAWAGVVNVFVRQLSPGGHGLGITGFAVAQGTPGLVQGPEAMTMGMRSMVQNSITLDRLRVDDTAVLGQALDGMAVAQDAMAAGRVAIGAMCLGGIKRCLQLMLRYAGRRSIGTGILAENPIFRAGATRLAFMAQGVQASLALAARLAASGGSVPLDLAAAIKVTAPEMFWQAADALVQCLGGRGYIEGNIAPQLLRDARVLRIFEGPTETMRAHLGARLLHGSSDIPALLEAIAPAAAHALQTARDMLAAVPAMHRQYGEDEVTAQRMMGAALGEIASQAFLLGALIEQGGDARAVAWFTRRIEHITAMALEQGQSASLHARDLAYLVDGFAGAIGDLEQGAAGEDVAPDAILRRANPAITPQNPVMAAASPEPPQPAGTYSDEVALLQTHLRRALNLPDSRHLGAQASFAELGLDSVSAVSLAFDLEDAFAIELDPTCFWAFITVAQLAAEIARRRAHAARAPARLPAARPLAALDVDALSDADAEKLLLEAVGVGP